jgi:DNA-binding LacI/PurR family transcriptional regulator
MTDFGLEPHIHLFEPGDFLTNPDIYPVIQNIIDTPDADGNTPTCFFDGGSINLTHIASILIRMGYTVPGDISLCGHGKGKINEEYGCFDFRSVFAIRETWMPLGQAAAGRLLARFAYDGLRTTLTLIPPEIVPGDSVVRIDTPPGR